MTKSTFSRIQFPEISSLSIIPPCYLTQFHDFKYHVSNCLLDIITWYLMYNSNQHEKNWILDFLPTSLPSPPQPVLSSVYPIWQYMKIHSCRCLGQKNLVTLSYPISNPLIKPVGFTFKNFHNLPTSHYLKQLLPYWFKPLIWDIIITSYLLLVMFFPPYGLFFP